MNPFEIFDLTPAPVLQDKQNQLLPINSFKNRYRKMQAACHPDSYAMASEAQQKAASQMSSKLNQAYRILADDTARIKAWLELQGLAIESQTTKPDMALFELQMSLDDRFAELSRGNIEIRESINQDISQLRTGAIEWFCQLYQHMQQNKDALQQQADECMNQFGRLALASRLEVRLINS